MLGIAQVVCTLSSELCWIYTKLALDCHLGVAQN